MHTLPSLRWALSTPSCSCFQQARREALELGYTASDLALVLGRRALDRLLRSLADVARSEPQKLDLVVPGYAGVLDGVTLYVTRDPAVGPFLVSPCTSEEARSIGRNAIVDRVVEDPDQQPVEAEGATDPVDHLSELDLLAILEARLTSRIGEVGDPARLTVEGARASVKHAQDLLAIVERRHVRQ
jgi:hypothetical protein